MLIFLVFKIASFSPYWLQIKSFMSVFFYLFTFVINLWHQKFVTAVFVNSEHSFQRQGQDFDKNTLIHSAYTVTCVEELKSVHLKCNLFAFFPRLLNICRKFEFLISKGSVASCLSWGGYCRMRFVANFMHFPAMQNFFKCVKTW